MKKKKRRPFTLLEIMIVICLIGTLTAVIGYNMKGSLNKGKQFADVQACNQVQDILQLVQAEHGYDPHEMITDPGKYLRQSGLVKNVNRLLHNSKGEAWKYSVDANGEISVAQN